MERRIFIKFTLAATAAVPIVLYAMCKEKIQKPKLQGSRLQGSKISFAEALKNEMQGLRKDIAEDMF